MNERELVEKYKDAKETLVACTKAKTDAEYAFSKIQEQLIDDLESRCASSTAKYDCGRVSLDKPRLFATVLAENRDLLYDYLKQINRDDLVKPSVHPSTLSSFVKEMTELGKPVPEFIKISSKRVARITA